VTLFRHSLFLEMAALLTWNSAPARPTVLGVVAEANRVHVNSGAVSEGATAYDGDCFSTETGGMLLLRVEAAMVELDEESVVTVRSKANGAQGTEAELGQGTVVFSAARAAALEIVAREARIRPTTDARTVAQVSITGPKELRINARRGALQFSYRGVTQTITEGESYRVILDPPGDDSKKNEAAQKGAKASKAFVLVAVGAAAAAFTAYKAHHHKRMESPDRP